MLAGAVTLEVDDTSTRLGPGDVAVLPADGERRLTAGADLGAEMACVASRPLRAHDGEGADRGCPTGCADRLAYRGLVQVQMRLADPIARGEVDLLFRRWKRLQATVGNTYRTAAGRLLVTAVAVVDPTTLTDDDARRSGHPDADALRTALRGDDALPTYRIAVAPAAGPDPRSVLAAAADLTADDVADLDRRLDRLDRASAWGPWTHRTLRIIEAQPATVSTVLAEAMGRERPAFKLDVRKLKGLGLTESLEIGYRLSPRGRAYLRRSTRPG